MLRQMRFLAFSLGKEGFPGLLFTKSVAQILLISPVAKTPLPKQGAQVQSLVGELVPCAVRICMPQLKVP